MTFEDYLTNALATLMVQARTKIKAMCLSVYGVKLWNSLSNNLRDCNSVTIFKKNLKKYLISIY